MNTLKPKYWYSAHLHISFDAIKKFPNGSTTRFTALDKAVGNGDHLRVKLKQSLFLFINISQIVDIPNVTETVSPKIEYDSEWLAILKESEKYMNCKHEKWAIPKTFDKCEKGLRSKMENMLSELGRSITCPELFDGSEINQTKMFQEKFLNVKT